MFCPRADLSLQAQEPKLQFCRRKVFHLKLRNQGCSFARDWIGAIPLLSAPHSLFSIWPDFKSSEKISRAPTYRWGEWIWLTGPSGLHRNSPQELNISSISVFNQNRDPEIPITLRPVIVISIHNYVLSLSDIKIIRLVFYGNRICSNFQRRFSPFL